MLSQIDTIDVGLYLHMRNIVDEKMGARGMNLDRVMVDISSLEVRGGNHVMKIVCCSLPRIVSIDWAGCTNLELRRGYK